MKKLFVLVISLFVATHIFAQSPINFGVVNSSRNDLSDEVKETLKLKIEQILGRQNAGANSMYNAFVIEPFITITGQKTTQGQMRNMTLTEAELTLIARNLYDGSIYQTSVTDVSSQVNGAGEAALKNLIRNINVNNAAFTRFIRTSRERILEHYNANCETIILKARTMINTGQVEEAIGYLSCVPEVVPCYVKATEMLEDAYTKVDKTESPLIIRDTVVITKEVEKIVTVEVPAQTAEAPKETPKESTGTYKYNTTCHDLDFNVVSCTGYASTKSIVIIGKITNKAKTQRSYARVTDAVDETGRSYGRSAAEYMNMPTDVAVNYTFELKELTHKINKLSYVELDIRNCTISLRDLPVTWK